MASPARTVNGVSVKSIVEAAEADPALVQCIPGRTEGRSFALDIREPDPQWPLHFQTFKLRLLAAFAQHGAEPDHERRQVDHGGGAEQVVTVQAIHHVGSTSVPGLPAKAIIDIDLVLSDNTLSAEPFYVPRLEAAGFEFRLREPEWSEHRFFRTEEPMLCHLHVWGPRSPEVERHRIFKEWLIDHEDDRRLYAQSKREASALSIGKGESMVQYNFRKEAVLHEILHRAFTGLGYLPLSG